MYNTRVSQRLTDDADKRLPPFGSPPGPAPATVNTVTTCFP